MKARPQNDLIKERMQGEESALLFEFSAADCRREDKLIQQLVFIGVIIPLGELTQSQQESRVQSLWQQGRNFLWVDFA